MGGVLLSDPMLGARVSHTASLVPVVIGLVVLGIPLLWWIGVRNGFIRKRNQCRHAYATIDVQLKKRHDLVPNLVAALKGIMEHEREVLENVVRLRSEAADLATRHREDDLGDAGARSNAERALAGGLGHVFALAEGYPEIQSSRNFLHFQKVLADIEDQIAAARRAYNSAATMFNNALEMFPSSVVGNSMSLRRIDLFEAIETERVAVSVDLGS